MSQYNSIFIKNIYHMLSYAFQNLDFICGENIKTENFDNIQDLLAVILYLGINTLLKRGIYKEYEEKEEALSCIKGKINFTKSISQSTRIDKKLICTFDEFTENTYINQILKSTCELLIRKSDIKKENKKRLKKIYSYFSQVEIINIKRIPWNKLSYHRNNISYKMLINICYLIIEGLLCTEEKGTLKINKYLDEQRMHRLYEKFILGFYHKHHRELEPEASYIRWNVEDNASKDLLPSMQSDITLTYGGKTLIIDAKFYAKTMQTQYEKKSFHSNNLYQIYTYVKNKDKNHTGNVSGMLLYAKTDEELTPDNEYKMDGNIITIRTLDLNQEWEDIENDLRQIGDNFKASAC